MFTLLLAGILIAAPAEVEVRTLDGPVITGSIVELDAGRLTVKTADGNVSLELGGLTGLLPKSEPVQPGPKPGVWVDLVDGSALVGIDYTASDGRGRLATSDGIVEIPVADIKAVRLQPQTEATAAEWQRILNRQTDGDLLIVRKGDAIDYHKGVLGNVTDKIVDFDLDGDVLPVKRSKVHGLIHHHPSGRKLPEVLCTITERSGSRWVVRTVKLAGGSLEWVCVGGLAVTRPLGDVEQVDFSQGKIINLGDLKPQSVDWTPFFATSKPLPALKSLYAPRSNRGLEPDGLRLGGKEYRTGLALHGHTKMVYRLPGQFRRFKATIGIDDRVRPHGNARLVIAGDDRVLLEATVKGTDLPKDVDLDITGVRRLSILVDFGEDLGVADHLDLCEARIVK